MSFRFLNDRPGGFEGEQVFTPTETFIDPVSKIRVSNPSNLIDTDFEYGLQPTKWETVELINNTPAFFSKGGDTTIPDIVSITTNAGTREITVETAFPHDLDPGIPIRVSGTKSVTADGSYIINATPSLTTFTYLARANQPETISIFDLYTSIITGEFFQGSQISIADAEGIITDAGGPSSDLLVKTTTKHGFGFNTPFYFLNLNSTVSQEFESQNNSSVSFDPTNSATALSFDGSNTLLQAPIDLSNRASSTLIQSPISSVNISENTFTVIASVQGQQGQNWQGLDVGDPVYYNTTVASGFFNQNPRGVVFVKDAPVITQSDGTTFATFQVSELPDGEVIDITSNITGFFKIADQARTFAGNNFDEQTQINLQIEVGEEFLFDGSNTGSFGDFDGEDFIEDDVEATVIGYAGSSITVGSPTGELDFYQGAMVKYETTDTAPNQLVNGSTYFIVSFNASVTPGLFTIAISEFPGQGAISFTSTGSGTQTFTRIGLSPDKDVVHIRDSNFQPGDMLEYSAPEDGQAFSYDSQDPKRFFFVTEAYDQHNYELKDQLFIPIKASGGNAEFEVEEDGVIYRVHLFNTPGSSTFEVSSAGSAGLVDYIVVAGGGGAGSKGGGGAGGVATSLPYRVAGTSGNFLSAPGSPIQVTDSSEITVVVGNGGGPQANGQNSSLGSIVAIGGGRGGTGSGAGAVGGSGGGGSRAGAGGNPSQPGSASGGLGSRGGNGLNNSRSARRSGGGGGGAGTDGVNGARGDRTPGGGNGGQGVEFVSFGPFAGGGGGSVRGNGARGVGGLGGGGNANRDNPGQNGAFATGGGGGAARNSTFGSGGSGIVIIRYPLNEPVQ